MMTTFTVASDASLKKTLHTQPAAALPKLAHELIDQLTVISLYRFKIHETFAPTQKTEPKTAKRSKKPYRRWPGLSRR